MWGKLRAKYKLTTPAPPAQGNMCDIPQTLLATHEQRKGVYMLAMVMWETKANENLNSLIAYSPYISP